MLHYPLVQLQDLLTLWKVFTCLSARLELSSDSIPPSLELSYDAEISFTSSPRSVDLSFIPIQQSIPPAVVSLRVVAIVEEVALSSKNIASGGLLRPELIRRIRNKSCSRKIFAAKLVEVTFDEVDQMWLES